MYFKTRFKHQVMDDQNLNIRKEQGSEWKEKKEAMQRLADALQTTSLPLADKTANSPPQPSAPVRCCWFIKLKTKFWSTFRQH